MVVIDPLKTDTAEKADEWIGIRPGTDGALALGIAHVMMERALTTWRLQMIGHTALENSENM